MTNTPTRPETMVERVARAIHDASHKELGFSWAKEMRMAQARAAIEAMREPTDAMVERAVPAVTISIDRGPALNREAQQQAEDFVAPRRRDAANIYRAMINAALTEGE